jgi:hypothetical protein
MALVWHGCSAKSHHRKVYSEADSISDGHEVVNEAHIRQRAPRAAVSSCAAKSQAATNNFRQAHRAGKMRHCAFLWLRKRSPGYSFLNQDTEKKSSVSERTVQCTLGTAAKYRSFLRHGQQATTPPAPPRSVVDRSGQRIRVRRCRDGCRRFNLTCHVSNEHQSRSPEGCRRREAGAQSR